jgi:hypothetical protein
MDDADEKLLVEAVLKIRLHQPSLTAKELHSLLSEQAVWKDTSVSQVKKAASKAAKQEAQQPRAPPPPTQQPRAPPRARSTVDDWESQQVDDLVAKTESLVQATLSTNKHLFPEGVDARALVKEMLSDPHAITNATQAATGRSLSDVLNNVEEFDIHFHCFTCKGVVPSHRSRCSRCKAIMYCSTACQKRDWKEGPGGGIKPHKHWCPLLQKHVSRLPEVQSLTDFFPWLRLTQSGIFPRDQVLAALGLLGEDKGYWSKPSSRASHAAQHQTPKTYGVMLHRSKLPTDEEGWLQPPTQLPRLHSLSQASAPAPLGTKLLSSWPEYYRWRGLPPSSVAALLMEYPLTLYFSISQLPYLMRRPTITVHLLGCEKELEFVPLFGELALLLPHAHIHIVLFGAELAQCYRSAPKASLARGSPLLDYRPPPFFDAPADHRVTVAWEHSYAAWQDALRDGTATPPDLVWAPNAGVAAYHAWQEVVFMCAFMRVPLATSEYCEYSVEMEVDLYRDVLLQAEQKGCIGASSTAPRRFLNPFRNPGQRPFPMNLAPNMSNGFCTILDLHVHAHADGHVDVSDSEIK